MKARAAVAWQPARPLSIEEIEVAGMFDYRTLR
jgi:hypothetical protein